ncbi:WHG domain-containing protein [Ruegeria pomeroyi]|uniref:TetR-like C-terminal domain-containing protein n=1 Tax=Ruegeria pomeroyi TaxID=89184 RepID=UPI001F2833BC|nr:TetR-like C-terminal domain-containing protein [Ruegeria pomeroyi]MCE8510949.1 WHG domain-containing protein [Ruegeria pomeroyi]
MRREFDACDGTPIDKLKAICRGYVMFSREEPALFRLILAAKSDTHWTDEVTAASSQSYGVLSEVCAQFEPPEDYPKLLEKMIWSLAHGWATLEHSAPGFDENGNGWNELNAILDAIHLTPKETGHPVG